MRKRSWPGSRPARGPASLRERREKLQAKRTAALLTGVKAELADAEVGAVLRDGQENSYFVALAAVLGTNLRLSEVRGGEWEHISRLAKVPSMALEELWEQIRPVLHGRLTTYHAVTQTPAYLAEEAKAVCDLIGADFGALVKQAEVDHPEPKSWKKLNADGTPRKKEESSEKEA